MPIMQSALYRGKVVHIRHGPVEHRFAYPHSFFCFDVAELPELDQRLKLFGYNRRAWLSLQDADYLDGEQMPVAKQLQTHLQPIPADARVYLFTSPRYFGYAFNPVNFYLIMLGRCLHSALAEVNNTFGDRHVYPLPNLTLVSGKSDTWEARCGKRFHVSPFNDLEGYYHFIFRLQEESLRLTVNLHKHGKRVISTWLEGSPEPLTASSILRHVLLKPLDTTLNTMPRILWQAALLHYRKRLSVWPRPVPSDPHTIKTREDGLS